MKSMTGFGKATEKGAYGDITVEIKTLNHKSLNVTCNSFNGFFSAEEKINKLIAAKILRGKVFVRIMREKKKDTKKLQKIEVDEQVAREYLRKIKKIQATLGLKGEISVQDVVAFPGVILSETDAKSETKVWTQIKKATVTALNNVIEYREAEGKRLTRDVKARLKTIEKNRKDIKKHEKETVAAYRAKLAQSLSEYSKEIEPDKGKMETEVAAFAKNCDIAEELTRLEGHLTAYNETIQKGKTDIGKKLDFMAQEMQREANTIGAKSSDFRISKAVITIKSEIEKIREQVKNIE